MDTPVTYKDSWGDIQKALITYSSHEDVHRLAKDAFELKSAIESIEQQRKMGQSEFLKRQPCVLLEYLLIGVIHSCTRCP